jgi:hypothetical protein
VDASGAGNAFLGAFAVTLSETSDLTEAAIAGSMAAELCHRTGWLAGEDAIVQAQGAVERGGILSQGWPLSGLARTADG